MLFHFSSNLGMGGELWGPDWFTGNAHVAVDIFFALSGYVLAYTYTEFMTRPFSRVEFLVYIGIRAGRIFPAHLAILGLFGLAVVVSHLIGREMGNPEHWTVPQFILQALLVHGWASHTVLTWNYVTWTVSVEWFSYLFVMPVLLLLCPRIGLRALAWFCAICWLIYWYYGLHAYPGANHFIGGPPLIRGGLAFAGGFLCFLFHQRLGLEAGKWGRVGDCAWMLATGVLLLIVAFPDLLSIAMLPAIMLLIFGCACEGRWSQKLLANKILIYIGVISYSLYLIHPFVQVLSNFMIKLIGDRYTISPIILLLANYAFSILLAHLSYRWVEEPGRGVVKKWMRAIQGQDLVQKGET